MIGKYRAEAGLNVYSSFSCLVPVEKLNWLKDKDDMDYHIYLVLATDEYYLDLEKTKQYEDSIVFVIKKYVGNRCCELVLPPYCLHKDLDHQKVSILSNYPYDRLSICIEDEEFLDKNPAYKERLITFLPINLIDVTTANLGERQKFEVLYIGQAYGHDGTRTAFHRLSSHETLQKILSDRVVRHPNKHIYILLLNIKDELIMLFDGITPMIHSSDNETKMHIKEVISDLPREKQVINITEAALINYFKPLYNKYLIENFPNPLLKGYRQYFDLDYNSLTIELDMSFINGLDIELYTAVNRTKSSHEIICYPLHNDNNRISMYEIFGKKK